MFAFCPITDNSGCGKSQLVSNATVQNITSTTIGRVNGNNTMRRKYDSCYYEISSVPASSMNFENLKDGLRVYVRVNAATNMNVYVYGGANRENATRWVMMGDAP